MYVYIHIQYILYMSVCHVQYINSIHPREVSLLMCISLSLCFTGDVKHIM